MTHGQSCNESVWLQERRGHEAGALARRHRLNWPEGAANRRSAKAVAKLTGLSPLLSSLGEESLQVPHWVSTCMCVNVVRMCCCRAHQTRVSGDSFGLLKECSTDSRLCSFGHSGHSCVSCHSFCPCSSSAGSERCRSHVSRYAHVPLG